MLRMVISTTRKGVSAPPPGRPPGQDVNSSSFYNTCSNCCPEISIHFPSCQLAWQTEPNHASLFAGNPDDPPDTHGPLVRYDINSCHLVYVPCAPFITGDLIFFSLWLFFLFFSHLLLLFWVIVAYFFSFSDLPIYNVCPIASENIFQSRV